MNVKNSYRFGKSKIYEWDVENMTFLSDTYISETGNPNGVYVSPDGTKMYVSGFSAPIFEYNLITPYNVSTKVLVNSSISISRNQTIFFKADGSRIYTCQDSGITQWNLSTPWDVSTIVNAGFLSAYNDSVGVWIDPTGVKLFVISDDKRLSEYTLSTPHDITTGVLNNLIIFNYAVSPQDLCLSTIGNELFIADYVFPSNIKKLGMETSFDLSTEELIQTGTSPSGNKTGGLNLIEFETLGFMYSASNITNRVYQHSIPRLVVLK